MSYPLKSDQMSNTTTEVRVRRGDYGEDGYKEILRSKEQISNGWIVTERVETYVKKKGSDEGTWTHDTYKVYYEEEPDLISDDTTFTGSSLLDEFK